MSGETFKQFSQLAGRRVSDNPELEQACDTLDEIPCSVFLSLLTVASQTRSTEVSPNEVIEGNRFHKPSTVSQRDFHLLEGIIHDSIGEDVDFIELSPVQPFGINSCLADINQKNIVSALRRSEVNADATTALFRIALEQYGLDAESEQVRVATNARIVRAQSFGENTSFLPHFKVFGQVSVGVQSGGYGSKELEAIIDHMGSEIDILDKLASSERSDITDVQIHIGNTALLKGLINRGVVDAGEVRSNTYNPVYSFIEQTKLDMPEYLPMDSSSLLKDLEQLGFSKGLKVMERFIEATEARRPDILRRSQLHIGRVAGTGYYNHICYALSAENSKGVHVPIADGGSTDWAIKTSGNRQLYTVTSGIGTELVIQHLLK